VEEVIFLVPFFIKEQGFFNVPGDKGAPPHGTDGRT
jgi:hypothetical protein